MPRIAREVDDAFRAVTLTRLFLAAGAPDARRLDLKLWKLLKRGSAILRAELATQLAQLPHGPTLTLRGLACDPDPDVAGPVLEHSAALKRYPPPAGRASGQCSVCGSESRVCLNSRRRTASASCRNRRSSV